MRRGRRTAARIAIALLTGVLSLALPPSAPAEHSQLELITTGPVPGGDGALRGSLFASPDGRRVLFHVVGALVPEDVDRCEEVDPETGDVSVFPCLDGYERFNGATSLVTTGPTDPQNGPMAIAAASRDRTRVFFHGGRLVAEDTNGFVDLYERAGGTTTLLSTGPSGVGPGPSSLAGVSDDGLHVFFATSNRLVPEDTDNCVDYYERFAGTTRLASTGVPPAITPFGSECASLAWFGLSADGDRSFLKTNVNVTSEDMDVPDWRNSGVGEDIYEWSSSGARLISTGPADSHEGERLEQIGAISRDGRRVVFSTYEQLVESDTDTDADLYVRFDGETSLVAPAVGGDAPRIPLAALSSDGSRVVTFTYARLAPEDTDNELDIYSIVDRSAQLLSIGPSGGNADVPARWMTSLGLLPATGTGGASEDALVVVFTTRERLVPADTDDADDLYASVDGVAHLVSTGTNDVGRSFSADEFLGLFVSPDGSRVFFVTNDPLAVEDTDAVYDVYEWHAGRTTVVPHGVPTPDPVLLADHLPRSFVHDGSRVFIHTTSQLTPEDTDSDLDVYGVRANGAPHCDPVAASPTVLRAANNRLVTVALGGATDPDGDSVTLEITGVTQDEPTGRSRDAVLSSAGDEVRLRAERDNKGNGRVYRIEFEASDGNGGSCSGTAKVSVPRKKNKPAVDSAPPSYNSFD